MGTYLSTPVREKESNDYTGEYLTYGASSMQGWRMSQEDAHSCQVDFDLENDTSLFAVYDGHGGAEVAQYTALHLPNFLKNIPQYKDGQLSAALEESFLGFDATLVEEHVVRELRDLAGLEQVENDEVDEEVKQEAAMLSDEATMPIEKLLERYGGTACVNNKLISSLKKSKKFNSPVVRKKSDAPSLTNGSNGSEEPETGSLPDVKANLEEKLVNGCCDAKMSEASESKQDVEGGVDSTSSSVVPDAKETTVESSSSNESESVPTHCTETRKDVSDASDNCITSSDSASLSAHVESTETCEAESSAEVPSASSSSSSADVQKEVPQCSSFKSTEEAGSSGVANDESEEDSSEDADADDSEEDEKWNSEENDSDDDDDDGGVGEFFMQGEDDDEDDDDDDEDGIAVTGSGEEPGADSGCTAVMALLRGRELYVANAGDSRCVLCRGGKAIDMSIDHKPEDTIEQNRITKAGGRVTCDGRVNGGLNLSRAIGDHCYKQNNSLSLREQMITSHPDVKSVTLNEDDRFMVLACDGIWNVMTSQDVVDFVQRRLDDGVTKLSIICEELFDFCLAPDTSGDGTGCDNMTCVIVAFNKLKSNFPTLTKRKQDDDECDEASSAKRPKEDIEDDTLTA